MLNRFFVFCVLALSGVFAHGAQAPQPSPLPLLPDQATLFVLNVSGPTLFASNQDITANGKDLVSLPRNTYQKTALAPGSYEFRFKPFPTGKRVAHLVAEAGQTYYLVVGYSPAKSWAAPLAGDPMLIKLIAESEALTAMQGMKQFGD